MSGRIWWTDILFNGYYSCEGMQHKLEEGKNKFEE
jgi:hypothetical protein